jgi:ribosomal protein S18 acetylase RimI-like enzyme
MFLSVCVSIVHHFVPFHFARTHVCTISSLSSLSSSSWLKECQISYLKNLQAADLERRRNRCPVTNEMFLAYEVRKTEGMTEVLSQPLLMDEELEAAYNLNNNKNNKNNLKNDDDTCYVRGELLGFVEITQRSYGLGEVAAAATIESSSSSPPLSNLMEGLSSLTKERQMRPVLTNLAVLKDSRKYGIGSKLLDACEEHIVDNWKMNEIILEVEDYNDGGLEFYKRRGYEVLFSDPASRRYDIQGFWLSKVRCRRDIMRKVIENKPTNLIIEGADSFFRRIRDTVGSF